MSFYNSTNTQFQFHKGTIRTEDGYSADITFTNFNSIKVRLEQWHLLPLVLLLLYFNSIKVRLELLSSAMRNSANKISIP